MSYGPLFQIVPFQSFLVQCGHCRVTLIKNLMISREKGNEERIVITFNGTLSMPSVVTSERHSVS
jgi:hypothetical protein